MSDNILLFSIFLIFSGAAVLSTVALYTRQSLLVAYMVLGMLNGRNEADVAAVKKITGEKALEFNKKFLAEHTYLDCRDLTGVDFHNEEDKKKFDDENMAETICAKLVSHAVEIVEEIEGL